MILYFVVDAFTDEIFRGNPAGVCPLDEWIDDDLMQKIATENRLSETAFFVPEDDGYRLRWFTPESEVDLCGHATLASASVLFDHLEYPHEIIHFMSKSSDLFVKKIGHSIVVDLPARPAAPCNPPNELRLAFGFDMDEVYRSRDYLVVLDSEDGVRSVSPDFSVLEKLDAEGVIVTAPGHEVDFVSRFFAPRLGIPEDPVTGSAHCTLAPYWATKLGKTDLSAEQISARGGSLACRVADDRVHIAGRAALYLRGFLNVP
jgi:predicted PhzF superfamily epimerase YddE/YHI9